MNSGSTRTSAWHASDNTSELVVIGGGAIGLSVAVEAARHGMTATVLEREPELGRGCTGSAAGLLNLTHLTPLANPKSLRDGLRMMPRRDSPFYLRPRPTVLPWLARFTAAALDQRRLAAGSELLRALGEHSISLHRQLADSGIATELVDRGILYACTTAPGWNEVRRHADSLAESGLQVRALAADEARSIDPALSAATVGAAYCEAEAHLDPLSYVRAMAEEARRLGVNVHTGTEVFGIRQEQGHITALDTTIGPVAGTTYVLAAGTWSSAIARSMRLNLPLQSAKGYFLDLADSPKDPRQPIYLHESRVVATPLGNRLRLAGTLELGTPEDTIDSVRLEAIVRAARHGIDHVDDRPIVRTYRGLRPCTPDGLPLLGQHPEVDNLIVATGHGMVGLVLAPVTAKVVRRLATNREPGYDLRLTRPDRFRSRHWPRTRPRASGGRSRPVPITPSHPTEHGQSKTTAIIQKEH